MALSDMLSNTPAMITCQQTTTEVILGPVSSESESYSVSVASHALEDGSDVSDHVHAQPANFSVTTFLADKNDLMSSTASLVMSDQSVADKIALLQLWQETGELLTYSGPVFSGFFEKGYDIYVENVVITSISTKRNTGNGSGIEVQLSLRKITIAETETAKVNLPQPVKRPGKKGKTETGKEKIAPKEKSLALKMLG